MPAFILSQIFQRVQVTKSELSVLQAILSKANVFGQHAKIAYDCIAGITGKSQRQVIRIVKTLASEQRRLLRIERRVLWPGHNAINVYAVVVPWLRQVSMAELLARKQARQNNKSDIGCQTTPLPTKREPTPPVPEELASRIWTRGSYQWYAAQGLDPPGDFVPVAN